jgi:conjugal transfer/type IV secretion protein DotA/TraY
MYNNNNKENFMKYMIYLIFTALLPGLAHADPFTPVPGSKAMVLLSSLFGNLGVFGPSGGDPFDSVIAVFNGAILVIAGLLVGYNLIAGIVNTAHDGEMLGKKVSSIWIPIRTALGTALVLPVIGGYCLMQKIVGMLIVMSIGLADNTWSTYVSKANLQDSLSIGLVRLDSKKLGYNILQSYVCIEALTKISQDPTMASTLNGSGSSFGVTRKNLEGRLVYEFGDISEQNGFATDTCGSIDVPNHQDIVDFPVQSGIWSTATGFADSKARMESIVAEHKIQLGSLISGLQAQAQIIVSTNTMVSPVTIDSIINKYELAVRSKATAAVAGINVFSEVSKNASQDGFVAMSTVFQKMNSLADLVQRSMAKVPTSKGPSNVSISNSYADQYALAYAPLLATLKDTANGAQYGISLESGGSNTTKEGGIMNWVKDKMDLNVAIKSAMTEGRTSFVFQQGENMVMAVHRLGNSMLTWGSAIFMGSMILLGTVAQTPGWANAVIAAMLFFIPLLMIGGFTLAFVIPFMPTAIIVSAILGWLIMCIEAIIIAPMWAVMHLTAGGDDMVGSGSQGYKLVLSLVLKPVLLVFGVIASLVLLQVFGDFIAAIFQDVFSSLNEDSNIFILLLSTVFNGLIYGSLVYTVIKRIFNIIPELPDAILKWITNSDNQLGSSASQIAGGNNSVVAAAAVMNKSSESMGSMSKGLGGNKPQGDTPLKDIDNKIPPGAKEVEASPASDSSTEPTSFNDVVKQAKDNESTSGEYSTASESSLGGQSSTSSESLGSESTSGQSSTGSQSSVGGESSGQSLVNDSYGDYYSESVNESI